MRWRHLRQRFFRRERMSKLTAKLSGKQEKKPGLRSIVLPSGLYTRYVKGWLGVVVIFILSTILLAIYKTPQCCIGYFLAGFIAYVTIGIKLDFASGKIAELAVTCTSVSENKLRKTVKVVFRTGDDPPQYYDFTVPGKLRDGELEPNFNYIIYFKPTDYSKQLLAYVRL